MRSGSFKHAGAGEERKERERLHSVLITENVVDNSSPVFVGNRCANTGSPSAPSVPRGAVVARHPYISFYLMFNIFVRAANNSHVLFPAGNGTVDIFCSIVYPVFAINCSRWFAEISFPVFIFINLVF